jgi:hypothetical protein
MNTEVEGAVRTAEHYEERFTDENIAQADAVLATQGLQEAASMLIRHELKYDDHTEVFEATAHEALVICPPLRGIRSPLLKRILDHGAEAYNRAHQGQ